jgi:ribonuclease D
MIDTPRVRARLALLARYRRRLAGLRDLPRDSYLRDHDWRVATRYRLRTAHSRSGSGPPLRRRR